MNFDLIKILLALFLLWPRGYVLIYLIDRSKAMSFGFKFFAGWVLGFAGFSLDVFGASAIWGQDLNLITFLMSSVTQIFGFGFLIFIAERRILYPKFNNFFKFWRVKFYAIKSLNVVSKTLLGLLFVSILVQSIYGVVQVSNINDQTSNMAWSVINQEDVSLSDVAVSDSNHLAFPLNNTVLKLWLLRSVSNPQNEYANSISIFYYLIFIGVFYHSLSKRYNPSIRLFFTLIFSSLPFIYWSAYISSSDILFALILFLTIACIFNFLTTTKVSFFYLSLIYLAFSLWTNNISFITLLPLIMFISVSLLIARKVKPQDFIMAWFWGVVTVGGWIYFLIINKLNIFDINFNTFNANTIVVTNIVLAPVLILFLVFYLQRIFVKMNI